jgi:hypothetical protein
MRTRIRCHVLETPTHDDWPRRGAGPRQLLPWADPYIAGLMRRLENRFADEDDALSDPYPHAEPVEDDGECDDGWQEDAFMPRPLEAPRFHTYPPVIGGFPLLDKDNK